MSSCSTEYPKIQHHKFSDMITIRLNNMWHSPLLLSYCLISMEMLPSSRLKHRESTLTKQPSSQALLKDYQSGASTSSKIGKPSSQALPNFRRFLLLLCAQPRGIQCKREQKDQHVEYEQQDWQAAQESASKMLRTTPSSLIEMILSSFVL